jgi:hypothetical protein
MHASEQCQEAAGPEQYNPAQPVALLNRGGAQWQRRQLFKRQPASTAARSCRAMHAAGRRRPGTWIRPAPTHHPRTMAGRQQLQAVAERVRRQQLLASTRRRAEQDKRKPPRRAYVLPTTPPMITCSAWSQLIGIQR